MWMKPVQTSPYPTNIWKIGMKYTEYLPPTLVHAGITGKYWHVNGGTRWASNESLWPGDTTKITFQPHLSHIWCVKMTGHVGKTPVNQQVGNSCLYHLLVMTRGMIYYCFSHNQWAACYEILPSTEGWQPPMGCHHLLVTPRSFIDSKGSSNPIDLAMNGPSPLVFLALLGKEHHLVAILVFTGVLGFWHMANCEIYILWISMVRKWKTHSHHWHIGIWILFDHVSLTSIGRSLNPLIQIIPVECFFFPTKNHQEPKNEPFLVGGLVAIFYFPIYWEESSQRDSALVCFALILLVLF